MSTDDDVIKLPVDYKTPPSGERMLVEVAPSACIHWNTTFEVDVKGGKCKCLGCQQEVSPMFVLQRLMDKESQWMRTRALYQDEMLRLKERRATKCRHCGAMTRISNR